MNTKAQALRVFLKISTRWKSG